MSSDANAGYRRAISALDFSSTARLMLRAIREIFDRYRAKRMCLPDARGRLWCALGIARLG